MTWLWRAAGVVGALVAALGLRRSTVAPWRTVAGENARVRQSWSARPERVERCRRLTDEELAQLPAHMRLRMQCEGGFARYLLTVSVDDRRLEADTLRGGGLRHDRPIHLFDEFDVRAGERHLRIEILRLDSTAGAAPASARGEPGAETDTVLGIRAAREADERARRASEAIPPRLLLDTVLTLPPRRVLLVVYDDTRRQLVAQMER